jgi:hypothetical protein
VHRSIPSLGSTVYYSLPTSLISTPASRFQNPP